MIIPKDTEAPRNYVYGVDIGRTRDETAVAETFRQGDILWALPLKSWQKMPFRVQKERLRIC